MAGPSFSRGLGVGRSDMGPVATAPTADDMSVDPRSTYGQPGSLDLPPALRGRAGGGLVSPEDRMRTLGAYAYDARQDALTGGGIPTINNPRGGVGSITGAQDLGISTATPNWVAPTLTNGRQAPAQARQPLYHATDVEAARKRLEEAGGLDAEGTPGQPGYQPARNYHPINLARASDKQIMFEDAVLAGRQKQKADAYFQGGSSPGATPASPTIGPDQIGPDQRGGSYLGPDGQRVFINPNPDSGFSGGPPLTSSTPQTIQEFAGQLDPEHQAAVYKAAGQVLGSTGNLDLASQIHGIAAGGPPPIPGPVNLDVAQQKEDAARERWQQAEAMFPGDKRTAAAQLAYTKATQDRVRAEADDLKHQTFIQKQAERLGFDELDTTKPTADQQKQLEDFRTKIIPQRQAKLDQSFQGVQAAQTKWQTAQDHEASLADKYAQELSDAQAKARATAVANLTIDPASPPPDSEIEAAADKIFATKQKLIDQTYALRIGEAQKQAKALETAAQAATSAHARLAQSREFQNLQPTPTPPAASPVAPAFQSPEDMLKANPHLADAYDQKYGAGKAAQVLGVPAPAAPIIPPMNPAQRAALIQRILPPALTPAQ